MKQNAVKTVDVWKKMSDSLQPKNLIPAIVQLDKDTLIAKQSISYLGWSAFFHKILSQVASIFVNSENVQAMQL